LETLAPEASPLPEGIFWLGQSTEGRDILGWRFGDGERQVLVVGGIHAGFEANTVLLVNELIDHFSGSPGDVLPGISLILIPVLNPDGLARGREIAGRFNGNLVDLNRNWGCEWSAEAVSYQGEVDPGERPFSEPETQALSQFIEIERPAAVLFYHSAAFGIFAGDCEGSGVSAVLAEVLGKATGYPYGEPFSAYRVTGTAPSWVDSLGIPAVDVELSNARETEFTRNLAGLRAVQCWLLGNPAVPRCAT
jgi:hypothetical protein